MPHASPDHSKHVFYISNGLFTSHFTQQGPVHKYESDMAVGWIVKLGSVSLGERDGQVGVVQRGLKRLIKANETHTEKQK